MRADEYLAWRTHLADLSEEELESRFERKVAAFEFLHYRFQLRQASLKIGRRLFRVGHRLILP